MQNYNLNYIYTTAPAGLGNKYGRISAIFTIFAAQNQNVMKNLTLFIILLVGAISQAAAQTDSLTIAKIKEEVKREVMAEIQAQQLADNGKVKSTQDGTKLKLYGFVRSYINYDTRECIALTGELFNIMPKDVELNENGEDINAVPKSVFVSFTSRFGIEANGPRILNAASSAKLEADFCGYSPKNFLLRIRHAYVQLAWERTKLLLGQTWHPSFNMAAPSLFGYSAGAPFATSSRSPQISLAYDAGRNWELLLVALQQMPDSSYGIDGKSPDYARWNVWPEIYASVGHRGEHLWFGAGVDILSIMPRKTSTAMRATINEDGTQTITEMSVRVKDRVLGISPELFADYKNGKFNIKGKLIYAENASHLTMLGGFGATSYDPETGSYKYAPTRAVTSWIDATYGQKWRAGLFLGYTDNLGAKKEFISPGYFWAFEVKNVDYVYRAVPSITYFAKNLEVALEADYTVAGYGDVAIDGNTKALRDVSNLRTSLIVKYKF